MKGKKLSRRLEPYLYLVPVLVLFGIFTFYPLARTAAMSLSSVNSMGEIVRFAGIRNFQSLFQTDQFWKSLQTTFLFAVCLVPTPAGP